MVLTSWPGWSICAAGTGKRYKNRVRSMLSRLSFFSVVLCVWYRQHRNSYLESVQKIPRNDVSQDLMRFWSYESLFWTIVLHWCSMFQWARAWFCFCRIMLDKETWRKDYRFLFFKCSLVWFLYAAKCEFKSKFRVYIKDWSPSHGSGATVLFVRQIFVSTHSEFEQHV